jgi:ubiquinone/menaquinone biosynthesis C-methylase UbiE
MKTTARKDYFSNHAKTYATFRPTYPAELFDFIFSHVHGFTNAWDCATGNGQVARHLIHRFKQVHATDISQPQLDNAFQAPSIIYSKQPAENTNFSNETFDLITVAQALHWFDTNKFFTEVERVGKKNSVLAIWGYSNLSVDDSINPLLHDFYVNTVGTYWDDARRHVENEYAHINFPFQNRVEKKFELTVQWTFRQFIGYVQSWSATQRFIQAKGLDPTEEFSKAVSLHWPIDQVRIVKSPLFLKMFMINT